VSFTYKESPFYLTKICTFGTIPLAIFSSLKMLVIRMQRAGRKNHPFYRIVVAEKSKPVKGRFLERLGHYNPLSNPKEVSLNKERIEYWISVGAAPSETTARLFAKHGISAAEKFVPSRVMKPSKAELKAKEEAEAKAKAEEEKKKAEEEKAAEENTTEENAETKQEKEEGKKEEKEGEEAKAE